MAKKRVIRCLILILTIVLAAGVEMFWLSRRKTIKQYKESQAAFGNPLMGYVPSAWYNEVSEDISLLYMDIHVCFFAWNITDKSEYQMLSLFSPSRNLICL